MDVTKIAFLSINRIKKKSNEVYFGMQRKISKRFIVAAGFCNEGKLKQKNKINYS